MKDPIYPFSWDMIVSRPALCVNYYEKHGRRKSVFIGVAPVDGAELCDDPDRVFATLCTGEKLSLVREESKRTNAPLSIRRDDGTALGYLPYAASVLPNALIDRGLETWCVAEAKSFEKGVLELGVSIWCEKY